jgi:flagellar basal-body rod modification protein FlgD
MTVSSVFSNYSASSATKTETAPAKTGMASLGSGDFLKLMTAQMQNQDPTAPVDNKEMLAQMAQFSTLAGTTEMGDTLKAIATKLDVLISAQPAAATTPTTAS